jgi:enoyl-CoA hydratase
MSEPVLLMDIDDGIATLTLNRPEARNALSRELRAIAGEDTR